MTQFPIEESLRVFHLDCLRVGLLAGLQRSGEVFGAAIEQATDDLVKHEMRDVYAENVTAGVALLRRLGRGERPEVASLLQWTPSSILAHPSELLSLPIDPISGASDEALYKEAALSEVSILLGALCLGLPKDIATEFLDIVNWGYSLRANLRKPPVEQIFTFFLDDLRRKEAYHVKRGEQLGGDSDSWMEIFVNDLFNDKFFTHRVLEFAVGSSAEPASGDFDGMFVTQYPWRRFEWHFHWGTCEIKQTYGPPITADFFERLKGRPISLTSGSGALSLIDHCVQNGVEISVISSTGEKVFEFDGRPSEES